MYCMTPRAWTHPIPVKGHPSRQIGATTQVREQHDYTSSHGNASLWWTQTQ